MTTILISIEVIAIVGFVLFRKGGDQRVHEHGTASRLMIVGLIPLGVQIAIFLLFGLGEMASGELSGAGHLLPAVATVVLVLLSWKRPIEGGAALFVIGAMTTIDVSDTTAFLIMAAPQIVSGLMFLLAGWIARGGASPEGN